MNVLTLSEIPHPLLLLCVKKISHMKTNTMTPSSTSAVQMERPYHKIPPSVYQASNLGSIQEEFSTQTLRR